MAYGGWSRGLQLRQSCRGVAAVYGLPSVAVALGGPCSGHRPLPPGRAQESGPLPWRGCAPDAAHQEKPSWLLTQRLRSGSVTCLRPLLPGLAQESES